MKKLLFLLLITVSSYGQTLQNPTFGTVTTKTTPTVTNPAFIGTLEATGVNGKIPSAYIEKTANKAIDFTTINNTLYPTVQAVSYQIGTVTPEQYGAIGDDLLDDSTALQNAINSGKTVVLGSKTYLTNSTLTITSVMEIKGSGNASIIKTTSNLPVLDVQSSNVKLSDFKILGSGRASLTDYTTTFPLQNGVKISGFYFDININKVLFDNLGNAGIYGYDNTTTSSPDIKNGVNVNNCEFINNLIGVFWDTEFEFNVISNCYFRANEWGVRMNSGNNAIHGGQIIRNRKGISLESGLNNAHSLVNGTHINQNFDNGIYVNGVTNGHVFSNCVVFFNKVEVISSTGITFDGGEWGTSTGGLVITGSTNTTFQNINFLTTPPITESGNTNLKFFNNTFVGTRSSSMPETLDNLSILNSTNGSPLKMVTGSGLNSGITTMPYGGINFGNAQNSTLSPLMAGKSNDNTGLFLIGMTNNNNSTGDFIFDVRENDNTDFADLTKKAFVFSRFTANPLLTLFRNGNSEFVGNVTSSLFNTITTTGTSIFKASNTGGDFYLGIDNSAGNGLMNSGQSSAYARVLNTNSTYPLILGVNNNSVLQLDSAGGVALPTVPVTSVSTYDVLTRNTSTGKVEKVDNSVLRPYKIYTALISQAGTSAPTVTILENTLGGTVVWTRSATGLYVGTLSGAFPNLKTFSILTPGGYTSANSTTFNIRPTTTSAVEIRTVVSGAAADGLLNIASLEIRVYP